MRPSPRQLEIDPRLTPTSRAVFGLAGALEPAFRGRAGRLHPRHILGHVSSEARHLESAGRYDRCVKVLWLGLGLALVVLGVVFGVSGRTQTIVVEVHDGLDPAVVVGEREDTLNCTGPLLPTSPDRGAYYPVDGRLVWPPDGGARPLPCDHNRIWLALGSAAAIAIGGAILTLTFARGRARRVDTDDQFTTSVS